ncbi:MAG: hypothetical protein RLZZ501_2800 [Pseudomonadota bacterium]
MQSDPRGKRDDLVLAALPHVAFDGWAPAALAEAAQELGLAASAPLRLFPGGPVEALAHFIDLGDRRMEADFAAVGPRGGKIDERVFAAIKLRLDPWAAQREAIRRGVALLALPANLPLAARLGWGTADALWRAVGDQSHDLAWATKRGSLAALYSATLFFWLDDASEGSVETWAFLRRRLVDLHRLPRLRHRVERLVRDGLSSCRQRAPWSRLEVKPRRSGNGH